MTLEKRIERLERALRGQELEVVMVALVDFVNVPPAPMRGWKDDKGFDCPRRPGETDEALAERAIAEAKVAAIPNESGIIVLCSYSDRGEREQRDPAAGLVLGMADSV